MHITTIGLDLAKSVFQAHGVDGSGDIVLAKRLHRNHGTYFTSAGTRPDMLTSTAAITATPSTPCWT